MQRSSNSLPMSNSAREDSWAGWLGYSFAWSVPFFEFLGRFQAFPFRPKAKSSSKTTQYVAVKQHPSNPLPVSNSAYEGG
jgi:hypothetical protein